MIALRGRDEEPARRGRRPVTVGDVEVHDGDWVVGDADGVTVVPRRLARRGARRRTSARGEGGALTSPRSEAVRRR